MPRTIKQLLKDAPRIRVRGRQTKVPFEWLEYLLTIDSFEAIKLLVDMSEVSRLVAPRINTAVLEAKYGTLDEAFNKALETNKQETT